MEILLPKRNTQEDLIVDAKKIVVVGANGSGKTRFGTDIETRYSRNTHRISAQKSLSMPKEVSPKSMIMAESEFLYGFYLDNIQTSHVQKMNYRWGRNPNTFLLNDYENLMVLLQTEEYERSVEFMESYTSGQSDEKPVTRLDKVRYIWESVLPHRKLIKKAGSINACPAENASVQYNASEMSDGERIVFYLIGEVVSVPENSIIVIDEPEMHIHKSITKKLWDKIEKERQDCTFIYLTHDIDFAISRQGATKIWAKSFDGTSWDYEKLEDENDLPEQLYLEILGTRKPVLFIEGNDSSIDYRLLQLVYADYTTMPLGGCSKVIETTKSFNNQRGFHNISSFGLIDRDRRTDEEISHIKDSNIWVAKVAEIENFLLLEGVVRTVASAMMKNPDDIFLKVKENVIAFFIEQVDKQALEHTISRVERIFKTSTDNTAIRTIDDLTTGLNSFWESQNFDQIYDEIQDSFLKLVDNEDYAGILKVFNNKGLVPNSGVAALCGINPKGGEYLNYILGILKSGSTEQSTSIIEAVKSSIES